MKTKEEENLKEILEVIHEEELIRIAYRLKKKGNKDLASMLKALAKDKFEKENKKND